MASAYKWRITDQKYAYITTGTGGDGNPFIAVGGMHNGEPVDDSAISLAANTLNEVAYANKYDQMCSIIHEDEDGKYIEMPDYSYFYNMDNNSACSTVNYGIQGVGISEIVQSKVNGVNTITFILTNGASYPVVINDGVDGRDGSQGERGVTGAVGASGVDGKAGELDENVVRQIVNEMNLTEVIKENIMSGISETFNDIYSNIQFVSGATSDAINAANEIASMMEAVDNRTNEAFDKSTSALQSAATASIIAREAIASATTASYDVATLIGEDGTIGELIDKVNWLNNNVKQIWANYSAITELCLNISQKIILFSGFVESINERFEQYNERVSDVEQTSQQAIESATTVNNKYEELLQRMETDETDISYITDTFIPNTQRKLSELENDVMELSGNTEDISDVLVTTGTVRNLITMMTQGDLSVLTERIDMIEQSATTHQHEYQNLYKQTMGFLDPNVDQLIQRVKDISIAVSGNTNDIENIKRQLSGV